MSPDTIATLAAAAVIIGFLWTIHRDVGDLRERMARLEQRVAHLEGQVQTMMQIFLDRERSREPST